MPKPMRSVSFSHKTAKESFDYTRSTSFNGVSSKKFDWSGDGHVSEPDPEETDITEGATYVVYEDHNSSRRQTAPKTKDSVKAINFSKRGKVLDLSDDDPNMFYELDPDQFVKDLKEIDPHNWDPLPCNILWAWKEVDKKGDAVVSRKDMYRLMKKYNSIVASNINVLRLIRKCDKNKDSILDTSEIHELLSLACGHPVSRSDSRYVMSRLEAMAKSSTHGGYEPTMTSDPLIVSKAIFEWWWIREDHRGAFLRRIEAARRSTLPTRDQDLAMLIRQREVGALDMNNLNFEDMLAIKDDALDLGLSLLKSVGDKVHKACSPVGQAIAGCATRR